MNARCRDVEWVVNTRLSPNGDEVPKTSLDQQIALMMDLRDAPKDNNMLLQRLCNVLECRNAHDIPRILRRIDNRLKNAIDKPVNNA